MDRLLGRWHQLAIFSVVVALIFSRRPDALLNPQFYAEDGWTWYADAWNLGWAHAWTLTAGGYLNTLPRLLCALAILVPLKSAPLVLNWAGIFLQALPVNILLSRRCANWGPLGLRAIQSALYVALPNSSELNVAITNAHWHLALVCCLLVFADPPPNLVWKTFDVAVLLLAGLTGPWAVVLTPLVLVFWHRRRQSWSLAMLAVLILCAGLQSWELFRHGSERGQGLPLGATPELFIRLVAGQIYAAAIWGQNTFDLQGNLTVVLGIFLVGTALMGWAMMTLRWELKLFVAFAGVVFCAALRSPLIAGPGTQWQLLAIDKGARYWFFPMLAFLWTLAWAAFQKNYRMLRGLSLVCCIVMLRGEIYDWRYRAYPDSHFGYYVRRFDAAARGSVVEVPVYQGNHLMVLVKH